MVIRRDAAASSRAPEGEIELALPPIERSGFPGIPSLIRCRDGAPGECGILVLGEDVWERGLKVTPLVISHNLLAGQRERLLLFEMAPRPICCRAFERVGPLVHDLGHYVRHTHRHSKWGIGLSYICSRHCVCVCVCGGGGGCWRSLSVSSCMTTAGSISAPSLRMASLMGTPCWAYPKGTITSVSWTKRRSGLWVLNSSL